MAITNPPSKRKHLTGPGGYLYINDTDNWVVTTPKVIVYSWTPGGVAGCFNWAAEGSHSFDDGMNITVNAIGELTAVS